MISPHWSLLSVLFLGEGRWIMRYLVYNNDGSIAVFVDEQDAGDYAIDRGLKVKEILVEDVHEYF